MAKKCAKCGKKKPLFGHFIECVNCGSECCKECMSKYAGYTKFGKSQSYVDSCPKCG